MTTAGRNRRGSNGRHETAGTAAEQGQERAGSASTGDDDLAALRRDFQHLREDVAALAEMLRATLQGEGPPPSDTREESECGPDDSGQWQDLRDRFAQARRHGREAVQDVETEVARHPLASLAVAFGAGYFSARLMHLFR